MITVETVCLTIVANVHPGGDGVKRGRHHETLICTRPVKEVDQRLLIVQKPQVVSDQLEAHFVEKLFDVRARPGARLVE